MKTFIGFLNENTEKYVVVAINRVSKDVINPVASDNVVLKLSDVSFLEKNATEENIQGDKWLVLDRELKSKFKVKLPNINKVGNTSGYNQLLIKKI